MPKKNKSKCRCNEELDIMCSECVRRDAIELIAKEVAEELYGQGGVRLVIEHKDRPFTAEMNRISNGGFCRSSIESIIRTHISRRL